MGPFRLVRLHAGAWLALAAASAFGGVGIFAKLAFAAGWALPPLLAVRFLVAALILAPLALAQKGAWSGWSRAVALGAFGYVAMTALYFASFRELPAAASTFMMSLTPVLVAAHAWATRGALKPRWLLALAASVAGAALMLGGAWGGALSLVGLALAGASALVYAALVVLGKRLLRALHPLRGALGICAGACLGYALLALPGGELLVARPASAWWPVLGLAALCTALPLWAFYAALARATPTQVAVAASFEPVAALGLGFLFLGESLPALAMAGGGFVLLGAALVALEPAERIRDEEPEAAGDLVL